MEECLIGTGKTCSDKTAKLTMNPNSETIELRANKSVSN